MTPPAGRLVWCPQRFFATSDLREDHIGIFGPLEALRRPIVYLHVLFDGIDQLVDASEGATPNPLLADLAKPAFHHVEP